MDKEFMIKRRHIVINSLRKCGISWPYDDILLDRDIETSNDSFPSNTVKNEYFFK